MRSYITKGIAILVLVGAYFGAGMLKDSKKVAKPSTDVTISKAFVMHAKNDTISINIVENGKLSAKYKIDLFSEVQGVMQSTSPEFKAGTTYNKGQVLVKVKSNDFYANLQAQKSVLQNLITSMLPDLKLDYPEAYTKWDNYIKDFDMSKPLAELPATASDKEKFFVTGRNIYTTYYTTKNLEIVLQKYTITAPFDGILTEALVTPGSLVRNGQKLGEFINPSQYELELAVSKTLVNSISVGKVVSVSNPDNPSQSWVGNVTRINGKINSATQTIQIFVQVNGDNLREGMYLEADIAGQDQMNAMELSRNLLIDGNQLYVVNSDSTLGLQNIEVLHKSRSTIIVKGLENGTLVLSSAIPNSYVGMKVNVEIQK